MSAPRKRKPRAQRRDLLARRDLLGLADYFDWLKAHPFPGDPEARDLAQALADGKIGDVRSDGQSIAGSKDVVALRLRLNRERARQGRSRPRGRPKKR